MSFHLGKPILVMLIAALLSGVIVASRPSMKRAEMSMWIFAESHKRSYNGSPELTGEPPADKYTRTTGKTLDVVLMNARAEDVKLVSLFNTRGRGQDVPDAVEIEISHIGKFFRPPIREIGLLPLNDFLKKSGWYDKIVKTRFAPWSKEGNIYGVPHDLHPTAIVYRKDLFDEAGVDLAAAKTWPEFREAGLKFRRYWLPRLKQDQPRWAAGFSRTSSDNLVILLQQRHVNLVDDRNNIGLNDPKAANTVRLYAEMIAGKDAIGTDFNPAPGMRYRDLTAGAVCAMITPDWEVGYIKLYAKDAAGKFGMCPLPRFDADDSPTASWGGTMIGIPRDCRDPQMAWDMIERMYFDHDALAYRRQQDQIIPPIREYWNDDVYKRADPFFMNSQNVNQMFIQLADQLPTRWVTPFTVIAQQLLADVLNQAVHRVDEGKTDHLEQDIQTWLDSAAHDLKKRIEFGTFED